MNKLPPAPRLLIEGDVTAAAPYVGLAKKLARQCYASGIRAKSYAVAVGTVIRVENYPESYLSKVFIRVIKKEELYAFIFLPKLIYAYRHPNASEPPWPLPDSIPVLPTADTNTNQYQAKYQYFPPKPPKTDWKAAVKLLDKNYRYGNQNFFYKNDIYSWWHSAGGDLSVGVHHPALFAWTTALGIQAFPVNEVDGASISKSSLERLPCYTPGMTSIRWFDNEWVAQSDALYLFGYFVESNERYYWYQLKPGVYKNNKAYYDFGISASSSITFVCGFYKGSIEFSDKTLHDIEVIAYQVNFYLTPGDVSVEILVRDLTSGGSFNKSLYNILGGGLIMNGLNFPIRFSEDGFSMAGLFHCAEGGSRGVGYFGEHILQAEFSINYEEQTITRTNRERFKYSVRSFGGGTHDVTNITSNTWFNTNLSYNTIVTSGSSPCTYNVGENAQRFKQTIDERSISTTIDNQTNSAETTGSYPLCIAYKGNKLIRANVILNNVSSVIYYKNYTESNGFYSETLTALVNPYKGTGLPPNPRETSNIPRSVIYDGNRTYQALPGGGSGCVGWSSVTNVRGVTTGTASASFRDTGNRESDSRAATRSIDFEVLLEIDNQNVMQLMGLIEDETTNYTSLLRSLPSTPSASLYDEYRNKVNGQYSNYQYSWLNSDGTSGSTSTTDWQYFRRSTVGNDATYAHGGEISSLFSIKQLSFLDLTSQIVVFIETTGEYNRTAFSERLNQNVDNTNYTATFSTSSTQEVTNESVNSDISNSSGNRVSKQSVSILLKKYGDGGYEVYIGDTQDVEREDDFSNSSFIDNSILFSVSENYDVTNEYDVTPGDVFSFMDLHSSRSVSCRSHINLDYGVYLASSFYQKVNFYFSPRDSIFGSYFPFVDEFYSYQLKGIDTNVPPKESASLQEPTNPDDVDIGNQLCPIGFLKT